MGLKNQFFLHCWIFQNFEGYIDVGDGCWRRNVLVTILRWWWRRHRDGFGHFGHQCSVANILKLSPTVSYQHRNITNMPVFWEILCQRPRLGAMLCAQSKSKWFYPTSEWGIHILDGVIYSQTLILNFHPVRSVDPWSEWNDGYNWWSRRWIFICFKTKICFWYIQHRIRSVQDTKY